MSNEIESIRQTDGEGLKAAGASWVEMRPMPALRIWGLSGVLMLLGGLSIPFTGFLGIMAVVVSLILIPVGYRWYPKKRSFLFERDGKMRSPQGTAHHRAKVVGGHHDFVKSVEVVGRTYDGHDQYQRFTNQAMNVALLTSSGQTIHVARDLPPDWAREVAVKLTNALEEMRQDAIDKLDRRKRPPGPSDDDVIN